MTSQPTAKLGAPASPPAADASTMAATLGPWQLVRLVHEGRLSRVYQAGVVGSKSANPPAYAVKVLSSSCEENAASLELFAREAAVGRSVVHPHLISVLASHVSDAPRYLVMPWLDGENLGALVDSGRRLSLAESVWCIRQVAEALDALNLHGWLHGDVKPANMMYSREGHATLIDLGFARRPDEPMTELDRAFLGSPMYLAPEALAARSRPDIRGDIYSLGVSLYELVAGRLPRRTEDPVDFPSLLRSQAGRPLRASNPLVPRKLSELLTSMLARDPLRRPQSSAELIERLVEIEIETLCDRFALGDAPFNREVAFPWSPAPARSVPVLSRIPG